MGHFSMKIMPLPGSDLGANQHSMMLEVAPGVYVAPDMSVAVRERVWSVMSEWWNTLGRGSLTLVWRDTKVPGNLRIQNLGEPPKSIVDADGVLLVKRK